MFSSGKMPIIRHLDQDRPAMNEMDESDFPKGAILCQKFQDGKIHSCSFVLRVSTPVEFNSDVYDKEMLPVSFASI